MSDPSTIQSTQREIYFSDHFEEDVRHCFSSILAETRMNRNDNRELMFALQEVALNAWEHSKSRDNKITLNFTLSNNEIRVAVRDRGRGLKNQKPKENTSPYRGSGLKIVRALSDKLIIKEQNPGLTVLITKKLRGPKIGGFSL